MTVGTVGAVKSMLKRAIAILFDPFSYVATILTNINPSFPIVNSSEHDVECILYSFLSTVVYS